MAARPVCDGGRSAPRWPGPGSSTSGCADAWFAAAVGRDARRRAVYGAGAAEPARRVAGRDGLGEPDRADHGRLRPERCLRRLGRPAARVRRPRGRARVLLQRRRRARWSASARRSRRAGEGRSRRRTATGAPTSRELAASRGRPGAADARRRSRRALERFRIHFDSWARQSELEQRMPELLLARHLPRADGAVRGALERVRRRATDRVIIRSAERGGLPTYRAADIVYLADKLEPRLRPRDLRPRRRPPRHPQLVRGGRPDARATTRSGVEVLPVPARAPHARRRAQARCSKRRGDVGRSSTSSSTRSASTRPAGTSSRGATTRRSRSTSTSPPSRRRRTPSTTSSTRTRGSRAPANAGDAAVGGRLPAARARRSASLVKRLPSSRGRGRGDHRRAPQLIRAVACRFAEVGFFKHRCENGLSSAEGAVEAAQEPAKPRCHVEVALLGALQHLIVGLPLAAYPGRTCACRIAAGIPSERASGHARHDGARDTSIAILEGMDRPPNHRCAIAALMIGSILSSVLYHARNAVISASSFSAEGAS